MCSESTIGYQTSFIQAAESAAAAVAAAADAAPAADEPSPWVFFLDDSLLRLGCQNEKLVHSVS